MMQNIIHCARMSQKLCHFFCRKFVLQNATAAVPHYHVHHQTWVRSISFMKRHKHNELLPARGLNVPHCSHLCTIARSFSSADQSSLPERSNAKKAPDFTPFYRLPSIVGLRILSRVKIAQTCLTLALLPPLYYHHAAGIVTLQQLQFSVGVATFALLMLYAMSFYLRRVVGAMYLHREGHVVKVSHLTFWGSRRDTLVPTADVVPLSEGTNRAGEPLLKLDRYSTNSTFYFTLRFGLLTNLEAFEDVFGKPKGVKTSEKDLCREDSGSG